MVKAEKKDLRDLFIDNGEKLIGVGLIVIFVIIVVVHRVLQWLT